jgi:hypothetical protein
MIDTILIPYHSYQSMQALPFGDSVQLEVFLPAEESMASTTIKGMAQGEERANVFG